MTCFFQRPVFSSLCGMTLFFFIFMFYAPLVVAGDAEWYNGQWPHEHSNLKPDPRIHFGRLPNGFRYVLVPHKQPQGRVSMFLNIQVGSLMEQSHELGFAHFVEHMAFNGSKNFPAGSLIPFFQANGMSFGGDTNAHTSLLETVYKLNLAKSDQASVKTGLRILRDFADGLLFEQHEVEDEKGVILSEKTSRDSENTQRSRKQREFLYSGTRLAHDVIGMEQTIKAASSESLRAFYTQWYRPERMVLVLVGDIEPEAAKHLTEELFADIKPEGDQAAQTAWGEIAYQGLRVGIDERPGSNVNIMVSTLHPRHHEVDSVQTQLNMVNDWIVSHAVQRRLQQREERAQGLWQSGRFINRWRGGISPSVGFSAVTNGTAWEKTLHFLAEERLSLKTYGLLEEEVAEGKEALREMLARAVRQENSISNEDLASQLVSTLNADRVATSAKEDLELFESFQNAITVTSANQSIAKAFAPENTTLYISGNFKANGGAKAVESLWTKFMRQTPQAYSMPKAASFPYLKEPEGPKTLPVLTRRALAQEGPHLHSATLMNGFQVHLLPTTYEQGRVSATLLFGPGIMHVEDAQAPARNLAQAVMAQSGLGRLGLAQSTKLLGEKGIGLTEAYGLRGASIEGTAPAKGLEILIQAMWTQYKDPAPSREAQAKVLASLGRQEHQQNATVDGLFKQLAPTYFYGSAMRYAPFNLPLVRSVSFEAVEAFVQQSRQGGPQAILVSGDFDKDQALRLITRLFSSLDTPRLYNERKSQLPAFPEQTNAEYTVADTVDKAILRVAWRSDLPDEKDRELRATRMLVATSLRDRLRQHLRERMGATYGASVNYRVTAEDEGYGLFAVEIGTQTQHVQAVREALDDIIVSLARQGLAEEEIARLRRPSETAWSSSLQKTETWHRLLVAELQSGKPYVAWHNSSMEDMGRVNAQQVREEAARMFTGTPSASLLVLSAQKSTGKKE